MKAVQSRNIIRLYSHCQITWKSNNSKNKLGYYQQIKVTNFDVGELEVINTGKAVKVRVEFDYQVLLKPGVKWLDRKGNVIDNTPKRMFSLVNVICEKAPFTPDLKGTWGVNPISFMKMKDVDVHGSKA
jgi:hypothetical protein